MKTRIISLAASGLLTAATASAQNNVVWFDTPTSLKGRSIWYDGHPEKFTNGIKPINAGDRNYNPDREWEERSLPLGNGSIGANILGSIATERSTRKPSGAAAQEPAKPDRKAHRRVLPITGT